MSKEKKEEQESGTDAILAELKNFRSEVNTLMTSKSAETSKEHTEVSLTKSSGHETIEDLIKCPNCYPKLKEAVLKKEGESLKEAFKKEIIERNKKPFICETCGVGVDENESSCPTCGGSKAKSRG